VMEGRKRVSVPNKFNFHYVDTAKAGIAEIQLSYCVTRTYRNIQAYSCASVSPKTVKFFTLVDGRSYCL
jgi:hypothetical protein